MKKVIIIFLISLSPLLWRGTEGEAKAQPNGGFEDWSLLLGVLEPDNWQTLNFLSALDTLNPVSAFKATGLDKHSGYCAIKLKTVYLNNNPFPANIGDSTSGVFKAKLSFSPFGYKYGFPYTGRPEKLEFWSKYIPVGDDTAFALVILKKWNGFEIDTIAIGEININATPGYSMFKADLVYYSTELPDSAFIGFSSSKLPTTARINSTLYVDDVVFSGWVGINKYDKNADAVKIGPNPARDNVNIRTLMEEADNVKVLDASGKLVGVYKIQNHEANINTGLFADGVYFYEIYNRKSRILVKGKFSVVK